MKKKLLSSKMLKTTHFERAIFFSWHCDIRDCSYCYMSTVPKTKKIARRTTESLLAELLLCKKLGWQIGFISGGIGAYKKEEFLELLRLMNKVAGEKFWLNIGALSKKELELYKPYSKGVVGSIETINEKIHEKVCPSKPIKPYVEMFKNAKKLGLKCGMTIIIGLGETIDDFEDLKKFIIENNIEKIHFYGLNPQKRTIFEKTKPPTVEYQAEWIKKTRKEFSSLDIQCGIWSNRTDYVCELLKAGADSISKFPAIKLFGKKPAKEVELQAKKAGRKFLGTLTKMPKIDWNNEVDKLDIEKDLRDKVRQKLRLYLGKMK